MASPTAYASFLVRMWRERDPERLELVSDWHSEVEHIQSGRRWTFRTLEETLSFLRRQADTLEISGQSVDKLSPMRGQGENHVEAKKDHKKEEHGGSRTDSHEHIGIGSLAGFSARVERSDKP